MVESTSAIEYPTPIHDDDEEEEITPQQAWDNLSIACGSFFHLFFRTWQKKNPRYRSAATRVYLLANVLLYGVSGAFFFLAPEHITTTHYASFLVNSSLSHVLWGLGGVFISGSNLTAVIIRNRSMWQIAAISTAMYASTWFATLAMLAIFYGGDWRGPFVWFWIAIVHLLLLRNRLVSVQDEEELIQRYEATLATIQPMLSHHPAMRVRHAEPSSG